MALELDPIVQQFRWDSAQFDAGITRSQQLLRQFQAEMARGEAGRRAFGQFPSAAAGERQLRALQTSLGGAERASAQTKTAIDRLNAAYAGGAVTPDTVFGAAPAGPLRGRGPVCGGVSLWGRGTSLRAGVRERGRSPRSPQFAAGQNPRVPPALGPWSTIAA
jgi:hypothetical protein